MAQDKDKRTPAVPKPPRREDVDQVSREQALITDEWAGDPPPAPPKKPE